MNTMVGNTKKVTIRLQVKELVYDILSNTSITGRAREDEGKSYMQAYDMQADHDDENIYRVKRSLTTALTNAKSSLSEYLAENGSENDNLIHMSIDDDGRLSFDFLLPANYNDAATDTLSKGLHAYLVEAALADWFTITSKEDAQVYIARAAASLRDVRRALYKRKRPTRPTH